jgi:hypothetical protein
MATSHTTDSPPGTPTLPKPVHKAVPYDQLTTLPQAIDYALAGYHAANDKASGASGALARLWNDAADAYRTAYLTIVTLQTMPADKAFPQAKDHLKKANHMADQAAASSPS